MHVNVYVVVPGEAGLCAEVPETVWVPTHAPDALHDVAFVDDQVNVDVEPRLIFDWLKASVIVGADGAGETATGSDGPPPAPPPQAAIASVTIVPKNRPIPCLNFICAPNC